MHIVNIASIYGLAAFGRFTAYSVSKFGLVGLGESLRAEYGRQGLGVSTICPGFVSTNLFGSAMSGYRDGHRPLPPRCLCTSPERVAEKVVVAIHRDRRMTPDHAAGPRALRAEPVCAGADRSGQSAGPPPSAGQDGRVPVPRGRFAPAARR